MNGMAEALDKDFKAAQKARGLSAEQVCIAYDKSPTSTWAYQLVQGKVPFTLAMVPMWESLTGADNFMIWIGGITKHVVAPMPSENRRENVGRSICRFGEFVVATGIAEADGKITDAECADIEKRSRRVMSQILGEVQHYRDLSKKCRTGRVTKLRDAS